ncbi:disease resistance protein RPM1-like [Silene latifolia]|uniref:disease resistance protein RPM1-like n=1 Tax=Silene latifolia TaxID=37657 RepID=UPI003D779D5E
MGEIYGTIEFVIQALAPLISDEISLISGLKDDVNTISNELRSISIFLKDSEERAEGDDLLKESTRQLRSLAYEIEDGIERYQLFTKETVLSKATQFLSFEVHSMASTIKRLLETTNNLAKTREKYRVSKDHEHGRDKKARNRLTTSYHQSMDYIDVDAVQNDIAKGEIIELLDLEEENSKTSTIVVVGMRGLGKTTLVDSVYRDKIVRSHFPLCAWIPVQERKENLDILRSLILQFDDAVPNINEFKSLHKTALHKLRQTLMKDKRYMVVFDGVQEDDTELADYISRVLLPSTDNGSKILMTTRYESVANAWLEGSINGMYKLKPLPSEKAWELFCKKTFRNSTGSCPSDLEDFARRIVTKCGGLPPAITSLGRLLSTKEDDMKEWERVCDNLGFYLSKNLQLSGIHKTFMEDYYALPFHLKPCLLYFGMFPKGIPIGRMRLIRLWIAEGFIRPSKGNSLTLEEIAEEYVDELIHTSFIEVKSRDGSGKVKRLGLLCEFFHEMILSKLEELSFCKILSSNSNKECISNETPARRLSIQGRNEDDDNSIATEFLDNTKQSKSSIRSLFIIEATPRIMSRLFSKSFFKAANLLKVLDLFNASVDIVPEELVMLLNLRYLSLRCTRVSTLPTSIGKLENLQTLDLKQTFISELPLEINKLVRLRHLLGYYYEFDIGFSSHFLKINGMKIAQGSLENCLELQELGYLDLDDVSQLRNLTQLRKLGIIGLKSDDGANLCSIINGMKYLLSLNVSSKSRIELIDLTKVKSPPRMLKRLTLNGQLLSIPTWVYELHGLVKIRLRWSNMYVDPLETLQLFPNLVELQLLEAYLGEHMEIASHGFQKLKTLHLLDLYHLKSLSIAEGALPLLSELSIGESENLEIPCDIQYLGSLKTLNFYNMPSYFVDQIRPGKPDYSIVKHVPSVFLHEKHLNGWQKNPL